MPRIRFIRVSNQSSRTDSSVSMSCYSTVDIIVEDVIFKTVLATTKTNISLPVLSNSRLLVVSPLRFPVDDCWLRLCSSSRLSRSRFLPLRFRLVEEERKFARVEMEEIVPLGLCRRVSSLDAFINIHCHRVRSSSSLPADGRHYYKQRSWR